MVESRDNRKNREKRRKRHDARLAAKPADAQKPSEKKPAKA